MLALVVPIAAGAGGHGKRATFRDPAHRVLFATDAAGNLHRFRANAPEAARATRITGLPAGVVLKGIDFRPATGDLYGLGSDRVVYRVNPATATPGRPNRISAGTFHPDARERSRVRFAAAVDPALYPVLIVTAEPGDGDPRAAGPEVLRSAAARP